MCSHVWGHTCTCFHVEAQSWWQVLSWLFPILYTEVGSLPSPGLITVDKLAGLLAQQLPNSALCMMPQEIAGKLPRLPGFIGALGNQASTHICRLSTSPTKPLPLPLSVSSLPLCHPGTEDAVPFLFNGQVLLIGVVSLAANCSLPTIMSTWLAHVGGNYRTGKIIFVVKSCCCSCKDPSSVPSTHTVAYKHL